MGIDPATRPADFVGRVTWHKKSQSATQRSRLVSRPWPTAILSTVGVPPAGSGSASERVEWTTDDLVCAYEPLTVGDVLGPTTHWPHVFAVMKALADRFGDVTTASAWS